MKNKEKIKYCTNCGEEVESKEELALCEDCLENEVIGMKFGL